MRNERISLNRLYAPGLRRRIRGKYSVLVGSVLSDVVIHISAMTDARRTKQKTNGLCALLTGHWMLAMTTGGCGSACDGRGPSDDERPVVAPSDRMRPVADVRCGRRMVIRVTVRLPNQDIQTVKNLTSDKLACTAISRGFQSAVAAIDLHLFPSSVLRSTQGAAECVLAKPTMPRLPTFMLEAE